MQERRGARTGHTERKINKDVGRGREDRTGYWRDGTVERNIDGVVELHHTFEGIT